MNDVRTQVLYVAGWGRSGSTLLDRLIGAMPGYVSLGEFRHVWARSYNNNELCGCGETFRSCPYWRIVRRTIDEQIGADERDSLHRLCNHGLSGTKLLRLWSRLETRELKAGREVQSLLRLLGRTYETIARHSRATVLVDSSKSALYARVLAHVPTIELTVLHIVRDSRAVAFSRKRKRRRPEIHWQDDYMPTFSIWRSGFEWMAGNTLTQLLNSLGSSFPYYRLRYEDFASSPKTALSRALGELGSPDYLDQVFVNETQAELSPSHTVSGNPMRFKTGRLHIRNDEEWRTQMPAFDRRVTTMLTSPMLAGYGYALRSSHTQRGTRKNSDEDR